MPDVFRFFVGLHQPSDAHRFGDACISINRLRSRQKPVGAKAVLVDSGAFTELFNHGRYRHTVAEYAADLRRIHDKGIATISAAVAQDYMCEPFIVAKTGLSIPEHQRLTIQRYDALTAENLPFPIMPVLQGFAPDDYVRHLKAYGDRLTTGMWVGVGSVCKRNADPEAIAAVLLAIKRVRPDLRLHGFGVKRTALKNATVVSLLATADSMAWSYSARKQGRSSNDWKEAHRFAAEVQHSASIRWGVFA